MGRRIIRRRTILGLLAAALVAPVEALAVEDTTPPAGTVSVVHDDRANELVRLAVNATDDLSGVATVEVSGDGTTWATYPYAPTVDWAVFDPAAGGSPALGDRTVRVRWIDAAGNTSAVKATRLHLDGDMALELSPNPVIGQPFTVRPIYAPGAVLPADFDCGWELRWGDTPALRDNDFNASFGSLFTSGKPDRGFCGGWTFTIPHVPVAQFEVYFNGPHGGVGDADWPDRVKFYPTGSSTDRRIRSSSLPIAQVLPDTYTMIVGVPITYRVYFIGTTLKSTDTWFAIRIGYGSIGPRYGTSTFTFTPPTTGNWLVSFNGPQGRPFTLSATYDPKARKPDSYRPNTTAPVQRIATGTAGDTVPVKIEWSGSDQGWGIAKYRLERSVNGGSWMQVTLPTAKSTSIIQQLARGSSYRYRVRAVDNYGNVGYWDYGPTFKPSLYGDSSTAVTYSTGWSLESDATALSGLLHRAEASGASARFQFTGRDIGWVAEKGPGKGRARVYVDGILISTIDLAAASDLPRAVVFRRHWSTSGSHVIRIVVEGTAGRPTVTLDGFVVLR